MLEKLREDIIHKARTEAKEIDKAAEADADKIVKAARESVKATETAALAEARSLMEREKAERLSRARIESKMALSEAKEDVLRAVFDQLREDLEKHRKGPAYGRLLGKLIKDGLKQLGPSAVIHVEPADVKIAKHHAKNVKEGETGGGVLIVSGDGRLRVDNTFPAMMEEKTEQLRAAASKALWRE